MKTDWRKTFITRAIQLGREMQRHGRPDREGGYGWNRETLLKELDQALKKVYKLGRNDQWKIDIDLIKEEEKKNDQ